MADRMNIVVLRQHAGILQVKDTGEIQPGDVIVIPESQENKLLRTLVIPIVQATATAVAAVAAIINLSR
jgi:hypothetical protein